MSGFRGAAALCCMLAALWIGAPLAVAQEPATSEPDPLPNDHPYTLHVYTDLLQIPTLVLDERGTPLKNLTQASFQLQLDAGPVFHPTAVHPEGEDPLTLAVVIDASGAEKELVSALADTPGHGLPSTLLPHDHVSVYAFDCKGLRADNDEPADIALAHNGLAHLLTSPNLHKPEEPTKTCRSTKRLWDILAAAANDLAEQPGRRALLILSDGEDGGSNVTPDSLRHFAVGKSIPIFVLRQEGLAPAAAIPRLQSMQATPLASRDALGVLSDTTGGLVLLTDRRKLAGDLDRFVALLRSRYILQFPRPMNGQGGDHRIDVHVANRNAVVRTAGISVPLRDAALMTDPNTVPSDTSKMPVFGNKRPPQ